MKEENDENGDSGMFDLSLKFWKTFLTIVAVALIFAGPTYVTYALNAMNVAYAVSVAVGVAMLVVGLLLLFYLIRKKVVV
jgi:hypothetical protein